MKTITKHTLKNFVVFLRSCSILIMFGLWATSTFAQTIIIPAANTNGASNRKPYGNFFGFERTHAIYTSTETGGAGGSITTLGFFVNSISSPAANTPVVIYMKNSAATTVASSTFATAISGATTVFSGTITSASLIANNFVIVTLTTPFVYSGGTLEIMVEANGGGSGTEGSTAKQFRWSAPSPAATRCQTWQQDGSAPTATGSTSSTRPNIRYDIVTAPCSGIPAPGNTVSSVNPACNGVSFTLSLQNSTPGSGITYQWQSSSDGSFAGSPPTLVALGTSSTQVVSQTAATFYRCIVTCANDPTPGISNPLQVALHPNCFCAANLVCPSTVTGTTVGAANTGMVNTCSGASQGAGGVWYKYVGTNTTTTISLCGSGYDTRLTVYELPSGNCPTTAAACLTGNDDFTCSGVSTTRSQVTFNAFAGFDYYVLVHGFGTATGTYTMATSCLALCVPVSNNDNCANATVVALGATIAQNNQCATVSPDANPGCGGTFTALTDVWYQITTNSDPAAFYELEVNTVGSSAPLIAGSYYVALYTTCGTYAGICGGPFPMPNVISLASGTLAINTTYRVRLYGSSSDAFTQGNYNVTWRFVTCPFPTAVSATSITTVAATVNFTSNAPGSFFDFFYGVSPQSTPVASTVPSVDNFNGGTGTAISFPLTGLNPSTTYQLWVREDCGGDNSTDISAWSGPVTFTTLAPPPANDLCDDAITISCPASVTGSTSSATIDNTSLTFCGTTGGTAPGVWYKIIGTGATMKASTCNSVTNYDTKLHVFSGTCGVPTCVTGNDDIGGSCIFSTLRSEVVWATSAGTDYYLLVHGFSTASGNFQVDLSCAPPCAIGTATGNIAVACGASLSGVFQLSIDSWTGDLQWQEEFPFGSNTWVNISGATVSPVTLNIPTAGPRRFRAQVSGFCSSGPLNSNNVDFLLDNPAAPTDPAGIEACGSVSGVISVTPSAGNNVRWYDAASGGTLLGTGNTFNVSLITTTVPYYAASYNPVTNCEGTVRTVVTATVNPFPVINLTNANPVICNPGTAPNSSALSANVTGVPSSSSFTNSTSQAISDNSTITSVVNVASAGTISAGTIASVCINMVHSFAGDLRIRLTSPSAVTIDLTDRPGVPAGTFGNGDDVGNICFVESGASLIPETATGLILQGNYLPEQPFSDLFGGLVSGTWTLTITDNAGGDVGTLSSWTITFGNGNTFSFDWQPTAGLSGTLSGIIAGSDPTVVTAQPVNDATYTVTIINAGTGCSSTASTSIVVNKAPSIVSLQSATLSGGVPQSFPAPPSFLDIPEFTETLTCDKIVNYNVNITGTPDPDEVAGGVTYSFVGATTGSGNGTGSGSTFGRLIPAGRTTVTITASNVCGSQSKQFRVTIVDNVAPIITTFPAATTNTNGGECTSLVQVTQPDLVNGGLVDNCPNASLIFISRSDGRSQTEPYYAGTTTVTWQATDATGNTTTAAQNVVVNNFKPVINSLTTPSNVIFVGQSATFTVNFTDEDGGGTHTVKFYRDKNDATPASTRVVTPSCNDNPCGSVNLVRSYNVTSDPIFYTVSEVAEPKVEVLDGCNLAADQNPGVSTYMYLAVAVAGQQFTTAGGHFNIPAGAFPSSYEGFSVSIGDVVKKQANGNSYKGQLEMNVHIPNLPDWRVHTDNGTNTDITWDYLTIGGCSLATFKGAVRINGATGYKVLVQQSDKDRNPATSNFIRVKVTTNAGAVVFDTQPGLTEALSSGNGGAAAIITALTNGSIKVQPANNCVSRIDENEWEGLLQNIPNPFTGQTEIRFSVPQDGKYTLKIYNYVGQEVATLFNEEATTGSVYSVIFDGSNYENGIYTYTLTGANSNETRRMNLIR